MGTERLYRERLAAARVHGDSMIDRNVLHGDVIIFQRSSGSLEGGRIVVIEKIGDQEGTGAWALKKIVIERPHLSSNSEFGDATDWDSPVIVLRSYNRRVSPWQLDPSGRYRVHGRPLRSLRPHEAILVDSDAIHREAAGEE